MKLVRMRNGLEVYEIEESDMALLRPGVCIAPNKFNFEIGYAPPVGCKTFSLNRKSNVNLSEEPGCVPGSASEDPNHG